VEIQVNTEIYFNYPLFSLRTQAATKYYIQLIKIFLVFSKKKKKKNQPCLGYYKKPHGD